MTLEVVDRGSNNVILLPEAQPQPQLKGRVLIQGDNNRIEIGAGGRSDHVHLELGAGNDVRIGTGCILGNLFVFSRAQGVVSIGDKTGFNGLVRLLLHEPGKLTIGSDCLFAGDVDVAISDMHSIIDIETGARINPARDVVIEDKVWIGQRAMLMKGAHIGTGTIIGAGSVVTGPIPAQVLAAGTPARVLRTGVTWRQDLI